MHAVSTNQIADILHFNDNIYYTITFLPGCDLISVKCNEEYLHNLYGFGRNSLFVIIL